METRRTRRIAIAVVAIVHLMLLIAIRSAMVSEVPAPPPTDDAPGLLVELYFADAPEAVATPEAIEPEAPVEPAPTATTAIESAAPEAPAMTARFVEREPVESTGSTIDTKRLFKPDGSVRLSLEIHDAAAATEEPDFKTPALEQPEFMTRKSPVDFVATRFDKDWVPDGESLGQEIARKYPLIGILLPGVHGDPCPPRSIDPECEGKPQPAFLDDPVPDEDLLE